MPRCSFTRAHNFSFSWIVCIWNWEYNIKSLLFKNGATVLNPLINTHAMWGYVGIVKTVFVFPRATEDHLKLLAFSPLGPSTCTAKHAAIPKGQGPELVQDPIPALSPVSRGQTLHLARVTGSEGTSNEQKRPILLKRKRFR